MLFLIVWYLIYRH